MSYTICYVVHSLKLICFMASSVKLIFIGNPSKIINTIILTHNDLVNMYLIILKRNIAHNLFNFLNYLYVFFKHMKCDVEKYNTSLV